MKGISAIGVLAGFLLASAAHAMPVFDDTRTGIDGLDIGGTLYDVTFTTGVTLPTVYGSPASFTFTSETAAAAAVDAILAFLNSNPGKENLSTTLDPAPLFQKFVVPYGFTSSAETIAYTRTGQGQDLTNPQWSVPATPNSTFSIFQTLSESSSSGTYWTSFSVVVPEPSTVGLLAVGLLGIGLVRRSSR